VYLRSVSQVVLAIAMIGVVLAASLAFAVMAPQIVSRYNPSPRVLALAGSPEVGVANESIKASNRIDDTRGPV